MIEKKVDLHFKNKNINKIMYYNFIFKKIKKIMNNYIKINI